MTFYTFLYPEKDQFIMEIGNSGLMSTQISDVSLVQPRQNGFHSLEITNFTVSQWKDYRFGVCEIDDSIPSEWVNVSSGTDLGNFVTFPLHNFNYIFRYENGHLQFGSLMSD